MPFALPAAGQDLPFKDRVLPALFNNRVQSELELTDTQKDKIKKLFAGIQKMRKEYGDELKELSQSGASKEKVGEKQKQLVKQLEAEKSKVQKDAFDVLLPHQVDRLRQVTVQVFMQEGAKQQKTKSGLLTKEMIEFLEIDEAQQKKILNKTEELQKKMQEELRALQDKYVNELLKELTAKQRKKYKDTIGDQIKR